jgi:hypothetical protein
MYSACSTMAMTFSVADQAYESGRNLFSFVAMTAYYGSVGSSTAYAMDWRGQFEGKRNQLEEVIASLQLERAKRG